MAIEFLEIKGGARLFKGKTNPKMSEELLQSLGVGCHNFKGLYMEYYKSGDSSAVVSAMRGASIPSLVLDGTEIFYNDPKRRNDFKQKLREGFRMGPQSGNFSEEQMKEYGYDLSQHGFLRDGIWERQIITNDEIAHVFRSDNGTIKKFPHRFSATQKILLGQDSADISLDIENTGEIPMRFSPGHHTYYKVSPDQKRNIGLDTNMGVNDKMKSKRISGEETIVIPNPGSCKIIIPGTGELQTEYDPQFKYLRLRSEKDKGFVCIEPVIDRAEKWLQSAIVTEPEKIMNVGFSVKLLSKDI